MAANTIKVTPNQNFMGWNDAIVVNNGVVEAVIVPSVGRVMDFRFSGDSEGPFWVNEKLAGKTPESGSFWNKYAGSYGGDKTWPAPQSDWNWPPPAEFDNAKYDFTLMDDASVLITSPVCEKNMLRAQRRISLDANSPTMRIETTYQMVGGDENKAASIWVIAQTRAAEAIYIDTPEDSVFKDGYVNMIEGSKPNIKANPPLIRLEMDAKNSQKIGSDGENIVWVGEKLLLKMHVDSFEGETHPDGGCSIEVYTNPDPAYVELETLSPMINFEPGYEHSETTVYTLARRTDEGELADVLHILASDAAK